MPSMVKNEASTVYVNSSFQATALLGYSKAMNHLRHQINRVAVTDVSVFLLGESGTGKELVAAEIHAKSHRKNKLFLPINCGAISPQLIESELFGHEKGSFTGADPVYKVTIRMEDDTTQSFAQESEPLVKQGDRVKITRGVVSKI